jgi:hypothetical protein
MPQPLSRVRKLTKGRRGGPFTILERPLLAHYVMGVISAWAHTEIALGRILTNTLHADSSAAARMYLSLSGGAQRREVLRAAAEHSLSSENLALFTVMMKAIKPIRERRNDFAHGIWSVSDELPAALLWNSADTNLENHERGLKQSGPITEDTLVYREPDLQSCITEAQEAVTLVHGVGVLIFPRYDYAHAETWSLLSTLPLLVKHGGLPKA